MGFQLQTQNELSCLAQGQGTMYSKKGAMVAYQGNFKFSKVLIDPNGGNLISGVMHQMGRKLTGENMELMEVTGQGACYFADEAQHVSVITLNQGDQLSIESENLLAFTDMCHYGVRFIGVGVLSQKGMFTSKLTPKGPGAMVAIKTNGNPLILQSPCVVDPDAVVCWTGADPSFKMDVNWKTLIGQTSGESYMLEFKQPGQTVVVQPFERQSGIKIGIDDKNYTAHSQGSAWENTQQNMENFGQNMQQGMGQMGGSPVPGAIGGIINGLMNGGR